MSHPETLLGIGQPSMSEQPGVLHHEGLVSTRREDKFVFYRIDRPKALTIMQVSYKQFCLPAKGVRP